MRPVRVTLFVASFACALAAAAPACKTPSQVTLDVGITGATCQKDVHSTAITVGVDPGKTEASLAAGYVSATTGDCDVATGRVGTLVVTPDDNMRASIIVTAAFRGGDASACKPPAYAGCVVARRRFSFVEHQKLTLPIDLDVKCVDVPCDEVSTCKNGQCLDSLVSQSADGSGFEDPSVPYDAGADGGGVEGGSVDGGGEGGPNDAGSDAGAFPSCASGALQCTPSGAGCSSGTLCCGGQGGGTCDTTCGNTPIACCSDTDCPQPGYACVRPSDVAPGTCVGETICAGTDLYCNGTLCQPHEGCCTTVAGGTTNSCSSACASTPYCCTSTNCDGLAGGGTCPGPSGNKPAICNPADAAAQPPAPSCDPGTGDLTCGGVLCNSPSACCVSGGVAKCKGSCDVGEMQDCCTQKTQCPAGQSCASAVVVNPNLVPLMPQPNNLPVPSTMGQCK